MATDSFSPFTIEVITRFPKNNTEIRLPTHDLGAAFNISMVIITLILGVIAILLNSTVMRFYKDKTFKTVPLLYSILSLSDFCTGICSLLHSVVFAIVLNPALRYSNSLLSTALLALSISLCSIRISAFVSLLLAVVRTINIVNPFLKINHCALVLSFVSYALIWGKINLFSKCYFKNVTPAKKSYCIRFYFDD